MPVSVGNSFINSPYNFTQRSLNYIGSDTSYVGIITHPNAAANDRFGNSVAVGNGRIVVGAYLDDIGGLNEAGSAHIYDLNGNYVGIITHPNATANLYFGTSVAVGNGKIVVCAPNDDIGGLTNAGSAHIYDLNGNYVGIITHPNAAANLYFGTSVAVGNGRIVVGAYLDDIGGLSLAGSALIYDLNGNYVGIITHPNAVAYDYFGGSVAIGNGRIVVGAYEDDIGIGLTDAGSAHIYDLNGNYVGIITHPNASAYDKFGTSVAIGNGRIVVGAPNDDIDGITVWENNDAGSAHIYDLNGNYVGIITHPNPSSNHTFGTSVAVGNGRIVVTSPGDNVNGISYAGSAHIYDLNGNYVEILTHSNPSTNDRFGDSVAVCNGRIVVGDLSDKIGGIVVGSAHIFNITEDLDTYYEEIIENYYY